jgi:hypothetical protein
MSSFVVSVKKHEDKIKNYLLTGKTSAAAKNMNAKL